MKFCLTGILAIGLLSGAYANTTASNPIDVLNPIDNGTGATCINYEQSGDWSSYCSCYAKFLEDNCKTCTHYLSFICGMAPHSAKSLSKQQDEVNCNEGVEIAKDMPECKRHITANVCTQQLVDYHDHC